MSVVFEKFVVVIEFSLKNTNELKANFVTCYQAEQSIEKINLSPIWHKSRCIEILKEKKKKGR